LPVPPPVTEAEVSTVTIQAAAGLGGIAVVDRGGKAPDGVEDIFQPGVEGAGEPGFSRQTSWR
jgi:hypothetical protein